MKLIQRQTTLLKKYLVTMELLLFVTDINSWEKVENLKPLLAQHREILDWCVDLEDRDNVLRIEATTHLSEHDVIAMIKKHGFNAKVLTD